jgi:hypothetical protein
VIGRTLRASAEAKVSSESTCSVGVGLRLKQATSSESAELSRPALSLWLRHSPVLSSQYYTLLYFDRQVVLVG